MSRLASAARLQPPAHRHAVRHDVPDATTARAALLRHPGRALRGLPPALHRPGPDRAARPRATAAASSRSRATSSSRSRPGPRALRPDRPARPARGSLPASEPPDSRSAHRGSRARPVGPTQRQSVNASRRPARDSAASAPLTIASSSRRPSSAAIQLGDRPAAACFGELLRPERWSLRPCAAARGSASPVASRSATSMSSRIRRWS